MPQIIVNGKPREVKAEKNILDLLHDNKVDPQAVVVELNSKIIKREKWPKTILKQDDIIEIISFVGGG